MVAFCTDEEQNHACLLSLGLVLEVYCAEDAIDYGCEVCDGARNVYILVVSTAWT